MKHVFSVAGLGLATAFVVVFFTGRIDSKHLTVVAPRVGMQADELYALVPLVASRTGATAGTSRRVVYLLACSGIPTSAISPALLTSTALASTIGTPTPVPTITTAPLPPSAGTTTAISGSAVTSATTPTPIGTQPTRWPAEYRQVVGRYPPPQRDPVRHQARPQRPAP